MSVKGRGGAGQEGTLREHRAQICGDCPCLGVKGERLCAHR